MRVRAVILVFFWFSQMGWCAEDSLRDAAQLLDAGRSRAAEGMLHRLLDLDPQTELTYGGIERVNATVGASYADKFFYTRQSNYGSAYFFLSPSRYIQVNLGQKRYNYPLATNPIPDANAYRNVPSIEVEVGGNLHETLRASLAYENDRPHFFFGPSFHANNHKLSGALSYQTSWKPRSEEHTSELQSP